MAQQPMPEGWQRMQSSTDPGNHFYQHDGLGQKVASISEVWDIHAQTAGPAQLEPPLYTPGTSLQFFSTSEGWLPCQVTGVFEDQSSISIDLKPGQPLTVAEQRAKLRAPQEDVHA